MTTSATNELRVVLTRALLSFSISTSALSAERHVLQAEAAQCFGGASRVAYITASIGYLVRLANPGEGVKFTGLPAAGKLAVRYASVSVGTITVAVNATGMRAACIRKAAASIGTTLTTSAIHPNTVTRTSATTG